ncbi:hypothetical protein E1B28_006456 [Marasmius oreades]|uniref:F-box domain-containing protein n=1 Tax=Marasmius oreades TaxID=181124 RepID=A0A9P7UW62_9AGAR|nr:uncharacterized protein E1B28_006456 [Marasmius oreades]KAG7095746.1 hypothetical protein E1B28_006456 [Marasmius oreades]
MATISEWRMGVWRDALVNRYNGTNPDASLIFTPIVVEQPPLDQTTTINHIHRLPVELLCRIFAFCAAEGAQYFQSGETSPRNWFSFTHVCRQWRIVAFDNPLLWTTPDFSRIRLVPLMLKNSRSVPLTLMAEIRCSKDSDAFLLALQHVSRTKTICLKCDGDEMNKIIPALLQPAPLLRTLSLVCRDDTPERAPVIPPNFLANNVSKLTSLTITNCRIHWDSLTLRDLSSLSIRVSPCRHHVLPVQEFVAVLRRMPRIQELKLHGLRIQWEAGAHSPHAVSLRYLRYLELGRDALRCASILNHINIPSAATIDLYCRFRETPHHETRLCGLMLSLSHLFSRAHIVKSLVLKGATAHLDVYANWESERDGCPLYPEINMRLVDGSGRLWRSWDAIVRGLAAALPLNKLRHLSLSGTWDNFLRSSHTLLDCFGPSANVETIEVEGSRLHAIVAKTLAREQAECRALTFFHSFHLRPNERESQPPIDSPQNALTFPHLRHLKLRHVANDRNSVFENYRKWLKVLLDSLMLRIEYGLLLSSLEFVNLTISARDIRAIEQIIGEGRKRPA